MSMGNMNKPKFDPSKPFDLATDAHEGTQAKTPSRAPSEKPPFNPGAAFSVADLPPDNGSVNEGVSQTSPGQAAEAPRADLGDQLQTQLESFGNTVTMGHLPHIQAIFEKYLSPDAVAAVDEELRAKGFDVPERSYVQARDENIARQDAQAKRNPESAVTGALGAMAVTAPIMSAVAGGNAAVQGLGGFSRLRNAAGTGFAFGALQNPGDEAGVVNPLQGSERLSNAKFGAAIGTGGQAIGDGVAKIGSTIKNAPEMLDRLSKVKAFKAAGAMLKDFRAARGDKAAEEVGETLLNKNIVSAGDTIDDIYTKTTAAKNEAGQKIRNIYSDVKTFLSNSAQNLKPKEQQLLQMTSLDGKVARTKITNRLNKFQQNKAGATQVQGKIDSVLAEIEKLPDDIGDWLEYRNSVDDLINYAKEQKDLPLYQQQLHGVRDEMTKMIQNRVRAVGKIVKDPDMISNLRSTNKEFGQLATVERFAKDRVARDNANRFFSLGDRVTSSAGATIGALSGDTPEERIKNGLIGFVGGRIAGKYGRHSTAMAARGAQALGKALQKPAAFAKFGEPLIEAAKRSPQEFQSLIQQFSQNPEFQKLSTIGAH
jgi:hypothetical protein